MGNRIVLASLSIILISIVGCATGHCWSRRGASDVSSQDRVLVAKADGSLQCSKADGITPEEMSSDLKEIEIYSKDKQSDGQMHMTVCGGPTGNENVYEIKRSDLQKAISLGFRELKKNDN